MRIKAAVSRLTLVFVCLLSPHLFAENLEEIFALARKNDAEWAAKKQKYLADHEKMEQAFGGLMPNASLNGSWGKQFYESDVPVFDGGVGGGINYTVNLSNINFLTNVGTYENSTNFSMYDVFSQDMDVYYSDVAPT